MRHGDVEPILSEDGLGLLLCIVRKYTPPLLAHLQLDFLYARVHPVTPVTSQRSRRGYVDNSLHEACAGLQGAGFGRQLGLRELQGLGFGLPCTRHLALLYIEVSPALHPSPLTPPRNAGSGPSLISNMPYWAVHHKPTSIWCQG